LYCHNILFSRKLKKYFCQYCIIRKNVIERVIMRADRLLAILLLLQANHRITAGELARRLEVSERTIYRDMEALGIAGIPVATTRGNGGGYFLFNNYKTDLTGLNEQEVRTLFLGNSTRLLSDLGLGKAADSAVLKLLNALPMVQRARAEYVRQRLYIDPTGWFHPPESRVELLELFQEALWSGRQVHLRYERGTDHEERQRTIDPLGLVAKVGIWYLVGLIEGNEIRVYRISRIHAAELGGESLQRPEDFDLPVFWDRWCRQFMQMLDEYPLVVQIAAERVEAFAREYGEAIRAQVRQAENWDQERDWVTIKMSFEHELMASTQLLGWGTAVRVVEPISLRERIVSLAQGIVDMYRERG
jgi:predicted DNA-binding transcriptional regulator YafY